MTVDIYGWRRGSNLLSEWHNWVFMILMNNCIYKNCCWQMFNMTRARREVCCGEYLCNVFGPSPSRRLWRKSSFSTRDVKHWINPPHSYCNRPFLTWLGKNVCWSLAISPPSVPPSLHISNNAIPFYIVRIYAIPTPHNQVSKVNKSFIL